MQKNNCETNHPVISGMVNQVLRDGKPLNFKGF